jgi:stage II sporulation protein D
LVRVSRDESIQVKPETRQVLLEGLRDAARYGTASSLGAAGIDALAKTGTAPAPGGGYTGIVVAATPADRPTRAMVLVAPGAAGKDAAAVAADILTARPPLVAAPLAAASSVSRPGAGEMRVRLGRFVPNAGYEIQSVELEEYVARVVAAEALPATPGTALEALAVTVRTFAIGNLGRHTAEGFDVCDLTHCQVTGRPTRASTRAAVATAGRVLVHGDAVARVFYSAGCGGRTEAAHEAWGGAAAPYLRTQDDPDCRGQQAWTADIPAADLERALRSAGIGGAGLRDLAVAGRTSSGRVARLRLEGMSPQMLGGEEFRIAVGRTLGWQLLKSTAFDLERTARGFRFAGHGLGHGVGLCVLGAGRMAERGQTRDEVFRRYFPGLEETAFVDLSVVSSTADRVRIRLPAADEHARPEVRAIVAGALAALQRRTGLAPPGRIDLRFHPSVQSYRRAAGRGWWTAAATRGTTIEVVPLAGLRSAGTLETTLRHELAHVLTEPALSGRPLWVREGAAMFFAGERPPGTEGPCPADAELLGASSQAAFMDAYARAGACFVRELAHRAHWSEVGRGSVSGTITSGS